MTKPRDEWEALVARFCPVGQRVCNCGQAYETLLPAGESGAIRCVNGEWLGVEAWVCQYGCSAAQINARDIVAKAALKRLPDEPPAKQP